MWLAGALCVCMWLSALCVFGWLGLCVWLAGAVCMWFTCRCHRVQGPANGGGCLGLLPGLLLAGAVHAGLQADCWVSDPALRGRASRGCRRARR